jgi:hypothetical protein
MPRLLAAGCAAAVSLPQLQEKLPKNVVVHIILGSFIGFMIGLMAWRMAVVTYMIREIGKRFDLSIQFGNPDKCGGLEPLGNLCLWNSLVMSIPGLYITGSIILITLILLSYFDLEQYFKSEMGISLVEGAIFIVPAFIIIFNFFISQWGIHKIMLARREAEWQELSRQFDFVNLMAKKIYQSDRQKRACELELLQKIYLNRKDHSYPTWPFSLSILVKFITGIPLVIVPITAIILNLMNILNEMRG